MPIAKHPHNPVLRIGASTTIAQYLLPYLLHEFRTKEPDVQFRIISANSDHIVSLLEKDHIEIALVEAGQENTALKWEPFLHDEIVIIASPSHPLLKQDASFKDLVGVPLIMREAHSGTRKTVEQWLLKAGMNVKDLEIVMELDSTEAVKSAVEAGFGIGFVSRWALRKERQLGSLDLIRMIDEEMVRDFQIVLPKKKSTSQVGRFHKFAKEYAHGLTGPQGSLVESKPGFYS